MTRIFLSYARNDRNTGEILATFLRGARHDVQLGIYEEISEKIILKSDLVVVIIASTITLDVQEASWCDILYKHHFKVLHLAHEQFHWQLAPSFFWPLTNIVRIINMTDGAFRDWLLYEAEWADTKRKRRKTLGHKLDRARERAHSIVKSMSELVCGPPMTVKLPTRRTPLHLAIVSRHLDRLDKPYQLHLGDEPELSLPMKDSGAL